MTAENQAIDSDLAMSERIREWFRHNAGWSFVAVCCAVPFLLFLIWTAHQLSVMQDPKHIKEVEQQAIVTRQANAKLFDAEVLRSITYLRDPATGFCFAHYQDRYLDKVAYRTDPRSITRVDCTKEVLDLIAKRHSGQL